MAAAYRAFAKKNPRAYQLIFEDIPLSLDDRSDRDVRLAAAAALLRILSEVMGEEKALLGARTLVSFLHGFLSMELNGLFRFGGDINDFSPAPVARAALLPPNVKQHQRQRLPGHCVRIQCATTPWQPSSPE